MSSSTGWQPPASGQSDSSSSHLIQIRAAQSVDLSTIAEILVDSFHSSDGIWGWAHPLLRLGIYEDLKNRLRSNSQEQHICLVAFAATGMSRTGDLAGTVEMALRLNEFWQCVRPRYLYLSNLAVHPSYRRRGVAQQLLLNCERVAISWGFQDLYLHVLENNYQARQLYFKLGYQLQQVDSGWNVWLMGRPRQLFLHKHLSVAPVEESRGTKRQGHRAEGE
ncbi:MAG: GNAT family N-acetyltransferase [Chroococcidiopsidaceae cyanobacterium CP_BM_RX_35]|nr:GNAT family N-acetyltransferase [Chroococcidiopsidaceae cyanobacterium CP_BM_RX_35]